MFSSLGPYVGGLAAFLASLSYIPQVRKAWPRNSTEDLSLAMLTALTLD
jgi:MtN3 and saliva related transmembrane protein